MKTVLIVDDDPHIRDVVVFALEKAGYDVASVKDGLAALNALAARPADLIVLDIGLPEMDGLEVCRQIRKSSEVPILFLSARDDEIDRVLGLEIGADDYVTKPFSPRELVARVTAILRRSGKAQDAKPEADEFRHGSLVVEPAFRAARFGDESLALTAIEFNILQLLAGQPRRVFSRVHIMTAAYDGNIHVSDRTIDSHVRNIRSKFDHAGCGNAIETVHGVGFRLGACTQS